MKVVLIYLAIIFFLKLGSVLSCSWNVICFNALASFNFWLYGFLGASRKDKMCDWEFPS